MPAFGASLRGSSPWLLKAPLGDVSDSGGDLGTRHEEPQPNRQTKVRWLGPSFSLPHPTVAPMTRSLRC